MKKCEACGTVFDKRSDGIINERAPFWCSMDCNLYGALRASVRNVGDLWHLRFLFSQEAKRQIARLDLKQHEYVGDAGK